MPYKKYLKTDDLPNYDKAILDILEQNPQITQTQIQELISKKPYKLDLTRMGLWKILNKLEKKGEIEKSLSDNGFVFQISPKSKIFAEFCGKLFQSFTQGNFIVKDGLGKEFGIVNPKTINADSLIQFFGFYVLYSIIASDTTLPKKQGSYWLNSALNLQQGFPMSEFFKAFVSDNEKIIKKIKFELKEKYKKNFGHMSSIFIETTYNKLKIKNPEVTKKMIDIIRKEKLEPTEEEKKFLENWNKMSHKKKLRQLIKFLNN